MIKILPKKCKVIIIGGGVAGCPVAVADVFGHEYVPPEEVIKN